ncbi:Indoleamine 2,3-dioxygenase [Microthyrium microscopicum]|uniref:Indoleamine 2,3-dioxygenase n=1 Tax=Microthyrium microscopicum TaxID=703497 RepID=A0A6A6UGN8_9PEZI|nr:Indoleamine 2,3-dioxygenase [Microthyrium microscopicum]
MYPPIPRLGDFDVSPLNGFLPTEPPCDHISDPYYAPWESIINNLQPLILTKRLRGCVDRLPVLSTDFLHAKAEWRRAYSILGFIVHAYVWGEDSPADIIPPPISIPFLETCEYLELPPVGTYASFVLWNWKPLILSEPVDCLENIFTLHTLTGSMDEAWFFLVSVAIEARGAAIIPLMLEAISAARFNDTEAVTEALRSFAQRLDELGMLLNRMYENCDPHIFYHRIRVVLAGSKNMVEAGLPNGIKFDTGSNTDEYVQYSGGSNAQSSIIQFFDIILGVEHRPTGAPPSSDRPAMHGPPSANFILEMRRYMPGPHRRFLEAVERIANIRNFVVANSGNAALRTAYDACLAMLRAFRDIHIQIVSRYIIIKSRESRPSSTSPPRPSGRKNLAVASMQSHSSGEDSAGAPRQRKLKGTGGTALIPFLKQARDETGEPAIDDWARRLLSNGPATVARGMDPWASGGSVGSAGAGARLTKMGEHASGEMEILGLAGVWRVGDDEGGICHW